MKKKIFLLIISLTPCLSWAKESSSHGSVAHRSPASRGFVCNANQASFTTTESSYQLGVKDQAGKIQIDIGAILKKQGGCESLKN